MPEIPEKLLDDLKKCAEQKDPERHSLLCSFSYCTLNIRVVFFGKCEMLLMGVVDKNVGWQIHILNNRTIPTFIPNETYKVMCKYVNLDTTTLFFEKLIAALGTIAKCCGTPPSQDVIEELIAHCKYDNEKGEKPFFLYWSRKKPTKKSLEKIQRYFGQRVSGFCYKHEVTAAWSDIKTDRSLDFITPDSVIDEVMKVRSKPT